jgi:hypothetical protein
VKSRVAWKKAFMEFGEARIPGDEVVPEYPHPKKGLGPPEGKH